MKKSWQRRPASTWAIGYCSLAATSEQARVEFTSPTTTTIAGVEAAQLRLEGGHDPRRLLGVRAGADSEVRIRLGQPELGEEDVRELGVVVLARVHERAREPRAAGGLEHGRGLHEVGPGAGDDEEVGHRRASSSAFSHAADGGAECEALLRKGAGTRGELVRGREVERLSDRRGERAGVGRRRDEPWVEPAEHLRRGADRRPDHRRSRGERLDGRHARSPRRRSSAGRRGRPRDTSRPVAASSPTGPTKRTRSETPSSAARRGQRLRTSEPEPATTSVTSSSPQKRQGAEEPVDSHARLEAAHREQQDRPSTSIPSRPRAAALPSPGENRSVSTRPGTVLIRVAVETVILEQQGAAEVAEDEDRGRPPRRPAARGAPSEAARARTWRAS